MSTEPSRVNHGMLRMLRWTGTIEGVSTIVLFFIAMPLKYWADMPTAVGIAGPIHGGLFVLLVLLNVLGVFLIPISKRLALAGVVGALFPGGPFLVDRKLAQVEAATPPPSTP